MTIIENLQQSLPTAFISTVFVILAAIWAISREFVLTILRAKLGVESQKELQSRQHQFEERCNEIQRDFTMKEKMVNSILDVSSERSKAVSQRKLEAAEAIWESIDKLNKLLVITEFADRTNFEKVDKLEGEARRKWVVHAQSLTKDVNPEFWKSLNCQWTRLYVSEIAWALYIAYSRLISFGTIQMTAVAHDMPVSTIKDKSFLRKAISDALPHHKETLEKSTEFYCSDYLDELREVVLNELKRSIDGYTPTKDELDKARAIRAELEKKDQPGPQPDLEN